MIFVVLSTAELKMKQIIMVSEKGASEKGASEKGASEKGVSE
jgi:hypothetical protein